MKSTDELRGEGYRDGGLDLQDHWENVAFQHELPGCCANRISVFSCNHENIFKCSGPVLVPGDAKKEHGYFPLVLECLQLLQNPEERT